MAEATFTQDASSGTVSRLNPAISKTELLQLPPRCDGAAYPSLSPEAQAIAEGRKRGRLLEAQRLKKRLSQHPLHARRAAERGEKYWNDLASSYQGTE